MTEPQNPQTPEDPTERLQPSSPQDEDLLAGAENLLRAEWQRSGPLAARRRRLLYALSDLSLFHIVGRDWVGVGDDGFVFGELDNRTSDLLVRRLEDLASLVSEPPIRPSEGQLGLDLDVVAGPTAQAVRAPHHLGAIR